MPSNHPAILQMIQPSYYTTILRNNYISNGETMSNGKHDIVLPLCSATVNLTCCEPLYLHNKYCIIALNDTKFSL